MPQIGALAPNLWIAGAFGDHATNTATMAGGLIAGAILDGDDRWRLFSPFGHAWSGGALGKVMVVVGMPAARAAGWLTDRFTQARAGTRPEPPVAALPAPEAAVTPPRSAPQIEPNPRKPKVRKPVAAGNEAAPPQKPEPRRARRKSTAAPKDVLRPKRVAGSKPIRARKPRPNGHGTRSDIDPPH
jgi:hypothetical protein